MGSDEPRSLKTEKFAKPTSLISALRTLGIDAFLSSIYLGTGNDRARMDEPFELFGCIDPKHIPRARENGIPYSLLPKYFYRIYTGTGNIELARETWPANMRSLGDSVICVPHNNYHGQYKIHVIESGKIDLDRFSDYTAYITKPQTFAFSDFLPVTLIHKIRELHNKMKIQNK